MKAIVLAAIIGGVSLPAMAADPMYVEQAPSVHDWSGAYAGVQIGYGSGKHARLTSTGFANSYNSNGFLGGVFVGYNRQFTNNIVLGAELDANFSGISGNDGGAGGTTDTTKTRFLGAARARFGYAVDRILIFASGGLAVGNLQHTNDGPPGETSSHTNAGWTAGGGAEFAMTEKISLRAEYRYYDLGKYSVSAPTNGVLPYSVDNKFHTGFLGLSYKF